MEQDQQSDRDESESDRRLGEVVRSFREAVQLNQAEAADRIGVHAVTLSRWERGVRPMRMSDLIAVANAYGVPLADLLRELLHAWGYPQTSEVATSQRDHGSDEGTEIRPKTAELGLLLWQLANVEVLAAEYLHRYFLPGEVLRWLGLAIPPALFQYASMRNSVLYGAFDDQIKSELERILPTASARERLDLRAAAGKALEAGLARSAHEMEDRVLEWARHLSGPGVPSEAQVNEMELALRATRDAISAYERDERERIRRMISEMAEQDGDS